MKKSINKEDAAEEKKHENNTDSEGSSESMMDNNGVETMQESSDTTIISEENNGVAGGGSSAAEMMMETTMGITYDGPTIRSDGGDHPLNNSIASQGEDHNAITTNNNNHTNTTTTTTTCPKWSTTLSTPTNRASFTPTTDTTSPKQNLHGLGLKYSIDRTKVLSRTGKNCSTLLFEIATLHDELCTSLQRICPAILEQASQGTPMEGFGKDANRCFMSFVSQMQILGVCLRKDIARPYHENSIGLAEEAAKHYSGYTATRGRCAVARNDALRLRKRYVDCVKEVDAAIGALRKARALKAGKKRKSAANESSNNESGGASKDNNNKGEGVETILNPNTSSYCYWEKELRQFGEKHGLAKQCELVIRASEEAQAAQTRYATGVAEENASVEEVQDAERMALDAIQCLEEERIVFLIGLLDRLLQDEKESLENMSLNLASVEPFDLADGNHRELPIPSSTSSSTTTTSLFMSPRRRAQSDDGPAINETRMLQLPDNIAEMRDNMKSLIGRQLGRLKTLKLVAAFNEGMASAIESFATSLKGQLETNSSTVVLNKNEGANVLGSWNSAIGSLEMYPKHAEVLAKQIRRGNTQLQHILQSAEREAKAFQEKEEFRWKSLCDAARVESKAKMKHKQCVADLEKARARLTLVEGEQVSGSDGGAGDGDNNGGPSNSPMKSRAQSTKMDRHMNKAMGRMFSILPGGGEDVMNKVLTPQQRQAIANRQLDEAQAKEEKGKESFEVARSVKQQAIVSYETEAEATEAKFKSEERNEWNEMQKSLVCSVDAMQHFREGQLKSVVSSIDGVRDHLGGKALEDVAQWTMLMERRVKDQRDRSAVDGDAKEEESNLECGFSLKVQLVERTDMQDLIRHFLDHEDVIVDDAVDFGGEDAAESSSKEVNKGDVVIETSTPLPDVPPDPLIGKMDPIFSKKLKNVSIDKYYSAGWSEDTPLYGPWLNKKGSFEVTVGDWEHSSDGEGFENAWSLEKFTQKRKIRFKFQRTTHLYIGPPIAGVTQTQYLMKDGNDRCVVMMTVEMDGIPYSDVFAVEVRWSARRVGENDIAIDAGVFVRFTKSSMFASKIKSGTLKETSPIHLDLFEVIKSAIASGEEGGEIVDLEVEPDEEITSTVEVKVAETATDETTSQVEGIFRQLVAAVLSLTQSQQLLLAFVVVYFVIKMLFRKNDPTADTIDDLAQKVDNLTNEVMEMKTMLLKMSEQSITER